MQVIDLSVMRRYCGMPSRRRITRRLCLAVSRSLWNRSRGPSKSYSRIANTGMLRGIVLNHHFGHTLRATLVIFSRAMQPAVCSSMRKEVPALVAPRFPILNLDERRLIPPLGFIFDARWLLPGESIVSILWKFARANGVPGHALVRLTDANTDPCEGVEPMRDAVDLKQLRRRLQLPGKVVCTSVLDAGQRGLHHEAFRFAGSAYRLAITASRTRCSARTAVRLTDRNLRPNADIAGRRRRTT